MAELSPTASRWLRKIRLALVNHGCGIHQDPIPKHVIDELEKNEKIIIKGPYVLYRLPLIEALDPKYRRWSR